MSDTMDLTEKSQAVTAMLDNEAQLEQKDKLTAIDYKMITFSLAGKDYAIDIMMVKEIAKAGRFTYVPNALPFVIGVYNLRGDIIPIIDFRLFFNIDVPERKNEELENLLIVTVGEQTFGAVVDEIHSVVGIQKDSIQPPHPLFGDISIKYIYGVVENAGHLYILLDIDRIFSGKVEAKLTKKTRPITTNTLSTTPKVQNSSSSSVEESQSVASKPTVDTSEKDLNFVIHDLQEIKQFYVSDVNNVWVKQRFAEWVKQNEGESSQLLNETRADEFLQTFWSACTSSWWTKNLADSVYKLLPDNTAKQIVVWNIGCGQGYETYSLCCLLKKRYPDAKIKIYAQDKDLLNVSNAPLLSIDASFANDWYAPYVTHKVNGEYTFIQEIKDSIMFEYHDCANTNALPMIDIVFARDVISLMNQDSQNFVIEDLGEKIKGNGIIILGDNESLSERAGWSERMIDSLVIYNKQ